jgi:hypothetical protein
VKQWFEKKEFRPLVYGGGRLAMEAEHQQAADPAAGTAPAAMDADEIAAAAVASAPGRRSFVFVALLLDVGSPRTRSIFWSTRQVLLASLRRLYAAEPANPLLERYQELLKAVTEKPEDFNTWTSLISTAEKLVGLSISS